MAENIYSKGTRVWFEDKEQAWVSAEVTSVAKGNDDAIKLVFLDERGKVRADLAALIIVIPSPPVRKLSSIQPERISKTARKVFLHCGILRC
jgi:hypothetical protein